MVKRPRYYVTTWDTDRQAFTPQYGVRCGPYSLFGLRRALRVLRLMGYDGNRGDNSTLVERAPEPRGDWKPGGR
jgi:hypothetical protein